MDRCSLSVMLLSRSGWRARNCSMGWLPFWMLQSRQQAYKVVDSVGAGGARPYVVQFETHVATAAIYAAAAVAVEDVGSDLPAEKGAALVLHAFHVGVHHQLWVELVPFEPDAADGEHPSEDADYAHGVDAKAVDGRRQRARLASSVIEARGLRNRSRALRLRRKLRRLVSVALMLKARCLISRAASTVRWPLSSSATTAMPVVWEPGSMLMATSCTTDCARVRSSSRMPNSPLTW